MSMERWPHFVTVSLQAEDENPPIGLKRSVTFEMTQLAFCSRKGMNAADRKPPIE